DAWRSPQLDKRRRRKDDDDDDDDYNETDPDKIGESALKGDGRKMLSATDARSMSRSSYDAMCERLRNAWRSPSHDAHEPDNSSSAEVMRRHLRTEPDDNAQARRDRAYQDYTTRLSEAGKAPPARADEVERRLERERGKSAMMPQALPEIAKARLTSRQLARLASEDAQ